MRKRKKKVGMSIETSKQQEQWWVTEINEQQRNRAFCL